MEYTWIYDVVCGLYELYMCVYVYIYIYVVSKPNTDMHII